MGGMTEDEPMATIFALARQIDGLQAELASERNKPEANLVLERKRFEQWYATHAFNYERDPIGSRDCGLQWAAWQAGSEGLRAELAACRESLGAASKALRQASRIVEETGDAGGVYVAGAVLTLDEAADAASRGVA